jgi:hypothetical protein
VAVQIAKVGNNLNQLAKWANTYKLAAGEARVIMFLADFLTEMKKNKGDAHGRVRPCISNSYGRGCRARKRRLIC